MVKKVHATLGRKWSDISIVTYKAYEIDLRFPVIAMNAMLTWLSKNL